MYIDPHGHVVIVDADGNAETFGLMDGGVDAAITAYFGSQLQERVQQNIIREYLGNSPSAPPLLLKRVTVNIRGWFTPRRCAFR